MTGLDFPPDDCRHPRHRGLRSFGRFAALEVTVVGAVFGAWALADRAWHTIRGER